MIPATSGSWFRRSISARSVIDEARPGISTRRPSIPTFAARSQDLVEVDRRRRVVADDHDGERRGRGRAGRGSPRRRGRRSRGSPPRSARRAGAAGRRRSSGAHSRPISSGSRASPLRTISRVCEARRSMSPTRRSVATRSSLGRRFVVDRRQVHVHVRRGRARCRDREQGGDLEVGRRVPVAAAGEGLGERRRPRGRPRPCVGHVGRGPGGLADRGGPGLALGVGLPRQLHRRAEAGVRLGVLVREGQEPVRERPAPIRPPRRAARRARRTSGGPPTATRPSRRAPPRGCRRRRRRCHRRAPARPMRGARRTRRPSGRGSAVLGSTRRL